MATALDYTRLRRDIGTDETGLPDADAEAIFVEAAEEYTSSAAVKAATRVIALSGMLAKAAKEVSYQQNTASEELSDQFKHLSELRDFWQEQLDKALEAEKESAIGGDVVPPTHSVRIRPRW